jgi:hypothetical protein
VRISPSFLLVASTLISSSFLLFVRLQNQDTLKTRQKCLKAVSDALRSSPSLSCVVDNTSPARSTRAEYISLIRSSFPDVKICCFWFTAEQELAMHNAIYRVAYGQKAAEGKKREMLPMIAFTSFKSRFEQPKIEEGAVSFCSFFASSSRSSFAPSAVLPLLRPPFLTFVFSSFDRLRRTQTHPLQVRGYRR